MYLFNFIVISFLYFHLINNTVSLELAQPPKDKVQGGKLFFSERILFLIH